MVAWIKFLPFELSEIAEKDYIPPNMKLRDCDKIIGDCPDELKPLYTLWRSTDKRADEIALKVKYGEIEQTDEVLNEIRTKKARANILSEMFWHSIQMHFQAWEHGSIGIREGWKIIEGPAPHPIFQIGFGGSDE